MANQATAGNTLNRMQGFSFVSGPFGPTPHLPPFSTAPGSGFHGTVEAASLEAEATPLAAGAGTPGGGPNNILTPDNTRDNASAKGPVGPMHPLTFNGG